MVNVQASTAAATMALFNFIGSPFLFGAGAVGLSRPAVPSIRTRLNACAGSS
jgi:hypothetical protein